LIKQFDTISAFTQQKKTCLFCGSSLRASLTNYSIPRGSVSIPTLNITSEQGKFVFELRHTTQNYDIQASGILDEENNTLIFTPSSDSKTPIIDQYTIKQAFIDMKPNIELGCYNSKCKNKYTLSSFVLDILGGPSSWSVLPLKLWLESFRTHNLIVQNDWLQETTHIFSRVNDNADPIKVSFMDFEAMGPAKLLMRVSTIVNFS
jgi:hypothetical protein